MQSVPALVLAAITASAASADIANYNFFLSDLEILLHDFESSGLDMTFQQDYDSAVQFDTDTISESLTGNGSRANGSIVNNLNAQGFTIEGALSSSSSYFDDGFRVFYTEGTARASSTAIFVIDEDTTFSLQSVLQATSNSAVSFSISQSAHIYAQGDTDLGDSAVNTTFTLAPGEYQFNLNMHSFSPHNTDGSNGADFASFSAQLNIIPAPSALALLTLSGFLSTRRKR